MKRPESLKARAEKMRAGWEENMRQAAKDQDAQKWRQHCDWVYALDCLLCDRENDPGQRIPFEYPIAKMIYHETDEQ